jgi:hypothetical protein
MDSHSKVIIFERNNLIFIFNFSIGNSIFGYKFWVPEKGTYRIIEAGAGFVGQQQLGPRGDRLGLSHLLLQSVDPDTANIAAPHQLTRHPEGAQSQPKREREIGSVH